MLEAEIVEPVSWFEANQQHLVAALAEVRDRLEQRPVRSAAAHLPTAAIETLCKTFSLTRFERALLLLCAGVELDSTFAPLCARLNGEGGGPYPTFSLALATLPEPHWSAINPEGALRRWSLIEVSRQRAFALTTSPLRIDERILHYLTGVRHTDERVANVVEPLATEPAAVPSQAAVAEAACAAWSNVRTLPIVQLCGPDDDGKREIAAAIASLLPARLFLLRCDPFALSSHEFETLVPLWDREAALEGSVLFVGGDATEAPEASARVKYLIGRLGAPVILSVREPWHLSLRPSVVFDVDKPTRQEQHELWRRWSGLGSERHDDWIDRIVGQFDLSAAAIREATRVALMRQGVDELGPRMWDAARAHARPRLGELAQAVRSPAVFEDLILPERQLATLREIGVHVAQRATVYDRWGFGGRVGGLGISALFAGPSGTGKTMAASVLATALRLDLYRIDLSTVVNKYIGETEKNLRRVFDAAENGGAILFFDEADALFGKRGEVKDSHDRYANVEINYLLQRIESYRGLAILATNMKSALDEAFLRRLRFIVEFPFPDSAARRAIWQRVFPPAAPLDGVVYERLAKLSVTGGSIRNIAMHGAFLAADANEPIRMTHLHRAARNEYLKLERPATEVVDVFGDEA